jgi:putative transposase
MLITIGTKYAIGQYVRRIKQTTNIRLWRTFPYLKNEFWREKTFWSDGYVVCSVGNKSAETIRKYIQEQGWFCRFIPATSLCFDHGVLSAILDKKSASGSN